LHGVVVAIMLGDGSPEPADTTVRVVIGDSTPVVRQTTCTDLAFDGRTDLECRQVTVALVDTIAGDTVAASIGSGRVTLLRAGCFFGWAVTDTTLDSVSVANYATPSAAMFGGAYYGTFG